MSIDYVIADEDVVKPTELSSPRSIYFWLDDEDGDEESDLLASASIWLAQNRNDFSTVLSMSFHYNFDDEPGKALLMVVE
jgi:hypothetical protein